MINVAETISPCILWIDEIDKAFYILKVEVIAVQQSISNIYSWLSEKTKPVLLFQLQ
jgi:SpoVK/Ycf46/Vps4 family AAA+-type ATPase